MIFNVNVLADKYIAQLRQIVDESSLYRQIQIVGIVSTNADAATNSYVTTLEQTCRKVGVELTVYRVDPSIVRLTVIYLNGDPDVHGIFVFYPMLDEDGDSFLRNHLNHLKDIEGLSSYWTTKLVNNDRWVEHDKNKAVVPCTPLGIVKSLVHVLDVPELPGHTFSGKTITIFNRSSIVGLPLAHMLANDGAIVHSFDINGGIVISNDESQVIVPIERKAALAISDVVITGVPSQSFDCVDADEITDNAVCVNFSFVKNFTQSAIEKARIYVPRVGPMTIAMCLRNAIRLYSTPNIINL
jgi:methylenetetrahydrofolate dehydrogenase (NADP+)/methenyltetrahydrofolate cyclohydrolase